MNYAEEGPATEQLAARFKNEQLAQSFKVAVDLCIDVMKARGDIGPEDD